MVLDFGTDPSRLPAHLRGGSTWVRDPKAAHADGSVPSTILTGRQIWEGRLLAGMEQADLARDARVALGLVVRIEAVDGMAMMRKPDAVAIRSVIEAADVKFIPQNDKEPSVRLWKGGA